MEHDERKELINIVMEERRERAQLKQALATLINDFDLDPNPLKPFGTHVECYSEAQIVEWIRLGLVKQRNIIDALSGK